ncbi:hypothetical protein SDC9_195504 [bioreactor metagenome]|uniref:Uncharacterized protein n=1 Tax=bioreactor metagenome TaxID=1076179 RepID=A0A645I9W4_9ZZZZ
MLHGELPDAGGENFPLHGVLKLLLDFIGGLFQSGQRNRPFLAGFEHAGEQFALVEGLAAAVFFDDHEGQALHGLVGGEPLMTGQAFPAAPDTRALVGRAGVHHLAFRVITIRTFHSVQASFTRDIVTHSKSESITLDLFYKLIFL